MDERIVASHLKVWKIQSTQLIENLPIKWIKTTGIVDHLIWLLYNPRGET